MAQDAAARVLERQGVRRRSPTRRRSWIGGCTSTTTSVGIRASGCRAVGTVPARRGRTGRAGRADRGADDDPPGRPRPARSASPPSCIRSGCGSPVRPSRCRSPTGSCQIHHRGVLVATHAQRHRPAKEAKALARKVEAQAAAAAPGDRRPARDPQGRLIRRRVASPGPTTGRQASRPPPGPSRDRRRAPSRSPPAARSSRCTRSATTAPASTAPSPTPAADPPASTPPNPSPTLEHSYRSQTGTRVPGLDIRPLSTMGSETS